MTFSIKVKNSENDSNWVLDKTLNNVNEVQQVKSLCKNNFWELSAYLIPVRTNNLKNFLQDFFIPTVTRNAIKIDSVCINEIFTRFIELSLGLGTDFGTLPFRVLTVIPRIVYNRFHSKEKDLFYQYLKSQGVSEDTTLKQDFVYVRFEWVENINGRSHQFSEESSIGFIGLPKLEEYGSTHFQRT